LGTVLERHGGGDQLAGLSRVAALTCAFAPGLTTMCSRPCIDGDQRTGVASSCARPDVDPWRGASPTTPCAVVTTPDHR
jgi:hypothetical protein